jgi:ubiquinone/menaquinone biosynthesis C-methylase UbiE
MMVVLDPAGMETHVIHRLIDFSSAKVLEVGCGDGRLTWLYAHDAASVTALDPNKESIKQARKSAPKDLRSRVKFRAADITTCTLPEAAFDIAVLSWSL